MSQAVINFGKLLCIELMGTAATVFGTALGVAFGAVVVIGGVAYIKENTRKNSKIKKTSYFNAFE